MESARKRTVLVVGAGLSIPAGLPSQRDLLKQMYEQPLGFASEGAISYHGFLYDWLPTIGVSYYEGITRVRDFVESLFVPIIDSRPWHEVSLEDVYSVLDRAIREGDSLPPYCTEQLVGIRHALDGCLVQCLRAKVESASLELHERLYKRLTELYADDWCTVSTNWDMLWDRVLQRGSRKFLSYGTDLFGLGKDGMYTIPAETDGPRIYKIHGSLDWLVCPCCHSVFVSTVIAGIPCPRRGDSGSLREPLLRNSLLTPSMLKVLANPTMRIIHDEAFHALRVAERVIFVGYSLPEADHDLRYLFRRAISASTEVTVVFKGSLSDPLVQRYKQLFGLGDRQFASDGFESFFRL